MFDFVNSKFFSMFAAVFSLITISLILFPAICFADEVSVGDIIVKNAKQIAANENIGYSYSYGEEGHENDVMCYPFVNLVLKNVIAEYPEDISMNMKEQKQVLENLGFVRHEFIGYDDPNLIAGSVIYDAKTTHVELYAGKYSSTHTDNLGNPYSDPNGIPVTIGARAWDRTASEIGYGYSKNCEYDLGNKNDPGNVAGDQYQPKPGNWWAGEVSGGRADYRDESPTFENKRVNGYYWGYYYAPENVESSQITNQTVLPIIQVERILANLSQLHP